MRFHLGAFSGKPIKMSHLRPNNVHFKIRSFQISNMASGNIGNFPLYCFVITLALCIIQ